MRLPEVKIKEAILHPDPELRGRAAHYFAEAYSPDPTIMPLVIQAVETHGRQGAYSIIGTSRDLAQTEVTLDWVINELNAEQSDQYENYTYNLSRVLLGADPALVLSREAEVLSARHFFPSLRGAFIERLRMSSWDPAACWRELETWCEKYAEESAEQDDYEEFDPEVDDTEEDEEGPFGEEDEHFHEDGLEHGRRIVEALARYGPRCEEKVLALLSQEVDEDSEGSVAWLELMAVRLAGRARVESAIDLIVGKLLEDPDDLLNEECAEALTRIGVPAVLHAVSKEFLKAKRRPRLYGTEPLERIHSDLAVEKCLWLLEREKHRDVQRGLAYALLSQFATEGIEAARTLLKRRRFEYDDYGLRNYLLETCDLMGERFPEYDTWRAAQTAEKQKRQERMREIENAAARMVRGGMKAADVLETGQPSAEAPPAVEAPVLEPILPYRSEEKRVGRNESCPCGSGKKFKNCCLKQQRR